jgi:hypothetical protein
LPPGNEVPVKVAQSIAQQAIVYFQGRECLVQCLGDSISVFNELLAESLIQVEQLFYVLVQNQEGVAEIELLSGGQNSRGNFQVCDSAMVVAATLESGQFTHDAAGGGSRRRGDVVASLCTKMGLKI